MKMQQTLKKSTQLKFMQQQIELSKMNPSEKADALNKLYRESNQHVPIDKKNRGFREIYQEICHYDSSEKLRLENIKVSRKQIRQYLRKRYSQGFTDKVMKTFNFAANSSIEEYCKTIDAFAASSLQDKRKLGFIIHDINGDGRICPNDVFQIIANTSEF